MAIVNSKAFSFSDTLPAIDMADDVKAWIIRYGSEFVSVETTGDESNAYMTCIMNNLVCFQIHFAAPDAYFWFSQPYLIGESPSYYGYNRWKNSFTGTLVLSNSSIYVNFDRGGSSYRMSYVCEVIGGNTYYGHNFNDNTNPKYLRNIYLTKYHDHSFVYRHIANLGYSCVLGTIDYTTAATITDGTNSILDPHFIGCSTIQPFQVYTFNGMNYYALDENTLVLSNNSLEE